MTSAAWTRTTKSRSPWSSQWRTRRRRARPGRADARSATSPRSSASPTTHRPGGVGRAAPISAMTATPNGPTTRSGPAARRRGRRRRDDVDVAGQRREGPAERRPSARDRRTAATMPASRSVPATSRPPPAMSARTQTSAPIGQLARPPSSGRHQARYAAASRRSGRPAQSPAATSPAPSRVPAPTRDPSSAGGAGGGAHLHRPQRAPPVPRIQ